MKARAAMHASRAMQSARTSSNRFSGYSERKFRVSTRQLHAFLALSGYCFEQSIPLRGIVLRSPLTEQTPLEWVKGTIARHP